MAHPCLRRRANQGCGTEQSTQGPTDNPSLHHPSLLHPLDPWDERAFATWPPTHFGDPISRAPRRFPGAHRQRLVCRLPYGIGRAGGDAKKSEMAGPSRSLRFRASSRRIILIHAVFITASYCDTARPFFGQIIVPIYLLQYRVPT